MTDPIAPLRRAVTALPLPRQDAIQEVLAGGIEGKLTVGSLFAGIGGIELGLERTGGFETRWQVEIDPYTQKVLAKHWPDCGRWDDVRTFPPDPAEDWRVDLICGGFPCQDISDAGKRVGIDGARSGLWTEFARIIRILRPRFVLVENSAALLYRGLGRVLGDLAASGYDAEWDVLPAGAFGAPHIRERAFLLAYSNGHEQGRQHVQGREEGQGIALAGDGQEVWSDQAAIPRGRCIAGKGRSKVEAFARTCSTGDGPWAAEPDLDRMADGIPSRMDRLRGIGNAVVPQVAQWIGERILEFVI